MALSSPGGLCPGHCSTAPPALCQGPGAAASCPCSEHPSPEPMVLVPASWEVTRLLAGTWLLLSLMDALMQSSRAGQVTGVCTPSRDSLAPWGLAGAAGRGEALG